MLSHDVSIGSEGCKPVTVFEPCQESGERARVLLTRRAASKEVQYDTLTKSQQGCVDVAMTREWDKWNQFGVERVWSHEVRPKSS